MRKQSDVYKDVEIYLTKLEKQFYGKWDKLENDLKQFETIKVPHKETQTKSKGLRKFSNKDPVFILMVKNPNIGIIEDNDD